MDRETRKQCIRHSMGHGLSPVPSEGAGFFDRIKGFAKQAYSIFGPMVKKAGTSLAKDIVSDLHNRVVSI